MEQHSDFYEPGILILLMFLDSFVAGAKAIFAYATAISA